MTEDRGSEDCLPPGTPLLQGQYQIDRFLNAGGFGITYLARDSLDRPVVIKECYPTTMCCRAAGGVRARSRQFQTEFESVVRLFGQEARRMSKLAHPNIVGVHDVFEEKGTAYMALEFVDGRDLLDVIEQEPDRLAPDDLRDITLKLLDAVAHVHTKGILHRDISPDNVLIDANNEPVLIDFGAARDTARNASRVLSAIHVVKDGYSPQEFYLTGTEQSPASDLYSLAATLYHLLIGEAPLYSHVRLAALAEQKPDPYMPLVGRVAGYDEVFLSAIDKTLSIFPKDRIQSADTWIAIIETGEMLPVSDSVVVPAPVLPSAVRPDPVIPDDLAQLIAETNVVVRQEQARSQAQAEAKAQRLEAERREAEAAKQRIRDLALREAEEAAEASARSLPAVEEEILTNSRQTGKRQWLRRLFRSRSRQGGAKQALAE